MSVKASVICTLLWETEQSLSRYIFAALACVQHKSSQSYVIFTAHLAHNSGQLHAFVRMVVGCTTAPHRYDKYHTDSYLN